MTYTFTPQIELLGSMMPDASERLIKIEPMFFSADMNYAWANGGALTRSFIGDYLSDFDDWVIDSRVHMLMPGWYPCIPGWHHDDVPRSAPNNQPNYDTPEYEAQHRMCVIGKSAMPEFLATSITLEKVTDDTVYKVWNKQINEADKITHTVSSGDVVEFDWRTFHRGLPAIKDCWRFFIRASRKTNRQIFNEKRSQVQVYMPALEDGW